MGVGLLRSLQTWDILLIYCNNQLKKYITPFSKISKWGTLHHPSDVCVRSFLCQYSYFNKTLLHKSSWVIKAGPWSGSWIFFFGDQRSDIVHLELSFWWLDMVLDPSSVWGSTRWIWHRQAREYILRNTDLSCTAIHCTWKVSDYFSNQLIN